jgi:hypothetical protein
MNDHRCSRGFGVLALVLAMHLGAGIWLLSATARVLSQRIAAGGLELVFITKPPPRSGIIPSEAIPSNEPVRRGGAPRALPLPRAASAQEETNAIHPPVDWTDEASRTAKDYVAKPTPPPRDFGFPQLPAAAPKSGEFAWNYAATHRIETLAKGGLAINLNDNCVLVLFPLPFAACALGTKKANGDLFMHMHESSEELDRSTTGLE